MKEKGVVAPIVVLAVIFGVALLSVGAIQSKNDLSQKLEAIISSKLEANIPKATIPEKLTEIETKEIKEDQKVNPDMIIIPGRIPILEGESIYKIYLPKFCDLLFFLPRQYLWLLCATFLLAFFQFVHRDRSCAHG